MRQPRSLVHNGQIGFTGVVVSPIGVAGLKIMKCSNRFMQYAL